MTIDLTNPDGLSHLADVIEFASEFEELAGDFWDEDEALNTLALRAGRDGAPHVLWQAWSSDLISVGALRRHLGWAWSGPEFPLAELAAADWRVLFGEAGYIYNGRRRASRSRPLRVYRGATPEHAKGWSWTTNVGAAEAFAFDGMQGRAIGEVWTVLAPPEAILARITDQRDDEDEVVCDPDLLPEPERVGALRG